jgi:hypothetical protein
MFPMGKIIITILMLIPQAVLHPIFWVIIAIIAGQYSRTARVEASIYGRPGGSLVSRLLTSILLGVVAGFIASLILIFIGVTITRAGVSFILPLAVFLMLIDRRFLCFSYAGGLVALSSLIFGWPEVGVTDIMILIAVLHLIESLLIRITGSHGALPLYMETQEGCVVGGFILQKFWPIPIIGMMLLIPHVSEMEGLANGLITMPDWWPLIKPGIMLSDGRELLFAMFVLPAALGYGDFTLTENPKERSSRTAVDLLIFSVVLLGLALLSIPFPWVQWLAAICSPLGHEVVIALGRRRETTRRPIFSVNPRGLVLLDVIPDSPADKAGFMSRDIIVSINGQPVKNPGDLKIALDPYVPWYYIEVERLGSDGKEKRFSKSLSGTEKNIGFIPSPAPGDSAHVKVPAASLEGPLARWFRGMRASRR